MNITSLSKSTSSSADQQQAVPTVPFSKDTTCVVCFKIVDIFSIGECDHPVCYECSTRMRVLCKQNECPICRRLNQKVIFTSEILPYRELDQKNRSCLYDKTFRICFTGQREQNAFLRLLEHTCNKCNKSLPTSIALKDHLRKEHELFYCDICTEHLKIFSFERRAYTREQLAQHRRKGDPDNKSHRGHPLCEYCDVRYLDRDELFRHLRKEHYFCHFCDADGSNYFYADHQSLRNHFLDQHYLCEEGDCNENIFTAAFRTDIDLKAHKASHHGQNSKQARTLEFQFTLAPRNRSNQQQRHEEEPSSTSAPISQAAAATSNTPLAAPISMPSTSKVIDARNEQEFPSLGNAPAVMLRPVMPMNIRNTTRGLARTKENFPALGGGGGIDSSLKLSNHNGQNKHEKATSTLFKMPTPTSGVALNTTSSAKTKSQQINQQPSVSTTSTNNKGSGNKQSVNKVASDFPALPGSTAGNKSPKDLQSDLIFTPPAYNLATISTKHRALVPTYESISSGASTSKITTVQRNEVKSPAASSSSNTAPVINSKDSFPALGKPSASVPPPQWLAATTQNKKAPQISRKLKVAPAPLLNSTETKSKQSAKTKTETAELSELTKTKAKSKEKNKENEEAKSKELPNSKDKKKKQEDREETTKANKKETNKKGNNNNASNNINSDNNNERNSNNTNNCAITSQNNSKSKNTNNSIENGNQLSYSSANDNENVKNKTNDLISSVFNNKPAHESSTNQKGNNKANKKAKTMSLADTLGILSTQNEQNVSSVPETNTNLYSAVTAFKPDAAPESNQQISESVVTNPPDVLDNTSPLFTYISPSSSAQRNLLLATHLQILLSDSVSEEFRNISRLYRSSDCDAKKFFNHCQSVMGKRFDDIFPELLSLLPDIDKQQELYNVYLEHINRTNGTHSNQLKACDLCKQIVKTIDFTEHWQYHVDMERDNQLNSFFPKLSLKASGGPTSKK